MDVPAALKLKRRDRVWIDYKPQPGHGPWVLSFGIVQATTHNNKQPHGCGVCRGAGAPCRNSTTHLGLSFVVSGKQKLGEIT